MSEDLQVKFLTLFKQHPLCVVDFVKVNGDVRVMTCTLDPSLLPIQEEKEKKERKKPQGSIAAFDVNKKDWRAFKVSSVRKFSIITETGEEVVAYTKE